MQVRHTECLGFSINLLSGFVTISSFHLLSRSTPAKRWLHSTAAAGGTGEVWFKKQGPLLHVLNLNPLFHHHAELIGCPVPLAISHGEVPPALCHACVERWPVPECQGWKRFSSSSKQGNGMRGASLQVQTGICGVLKYVKNLRVWSWCFTLL